MSAIYEPILSWKRQYPLGIQQGRYIMQWSKLPSNHLPNIHDVPNRPFVLQLLNRRAPAVDKGTPKKRKRSPEWTPTVEPMFRRVAGPSNPRTPSSPTKQPKSPSRKLKASSDSEDAVEITIPSSDVDEDEISTNPTRLNPQGTYYYYYYYFR